MPIFLWEGDAPLWDAAIGQPRPALTPYLAKNSRGAVIVCPGGGYHHRATHEGEPVARMLNGHGISAFVLDYRVAPYRHPAPLLDVQRAIRFLRANAGEYGIAPDKLGVLGFSAGGHLTACAGTMWDEGDPNAADPIDRASCRPDAIAPCYAVISFARFAHQGSVANLLGEDTSWARRREVSPEEYVTPRTPPAFLWHTAEDAGVPVEHSLIFAEALSRCHVPFALHVFPHGRHGLGLAEETPLTNGWGALCGAWFKDVGF